jgi:non-homologous end joining protein Ku
VRDLIEEKKKGHVSKPAQAPRADNVVDLMSALRRSLKAGGEPDREERAAALQRREGARRGPSVKPWPRHRGRAA